MGVAHIRIISRFNMFIVVHCFRKRFTRLVDGLLQSTTIQNENMYLEVLHGTRKMHKLTRFYGIV